MREETQTDYNWVRDRYFEHWEKANTDYGVSYFPNVTMGWDASPRTNQNDSLVDIGYPFMAKMGGNTPEAFKAALEETKLFMKNNPDCGNTFNINCWNEWTDGSYLEPDLRSEYKYLEAVRDVFGEKIEINNLKNKKDDYRSHFKCLTVSWFGRTC